MCRLLVFKGVEPIQLSNLVTKPAHSIINQAFDARLRLDATRSVNGDGFGLGWYDADTVASGSGSSSGSGNESTPRPRDDFESSTAPAALQPSRSTSSSGPQPKPSAKDVNPEAPCIFTSVTPAWNNQNLQRLCEKIRSPLVFAHIRASTSGALSETNCHPWRFGRLMWMHNGQISGFSALKRTLLTSLDDDLLNFPQGQTDSEWAFALFLSHLDRPGRAEPFHWKELKSAMEKTIGDLNSWAKERGVSEPSLMNFCVTDGLSILCTRYVSSLHDEAASLYFSSGTSFYEREKGRFRMKKEDRRQNIVVVASEPLTFEKADWMEVPTNTMIIVTPKMNVLQIPILDEYSPLDRPDPSRAPRAKEAARGAPEPARGSHLSASDARALNGASITQPSALSEVISPSADAQQDERPAPSAAPLSESSHLKADAQPQPQRSPAFALHAGFPPNGHIGVGMGKERPRPEREPSRDRKG